MSRQLEAEVERRQTKARTELLLAVYGGLAGSVEQVGGVLLGFSAKLRRGDCLLTIRADFEGRRMVCFVGGQDLAEGLVKAVREVGQNKVSWREDRYS